MPQPKIRPSAPEPFGPDTSTTAAAAEMEAWDWPQISAAGAQSPARRMQAALHAEYLVQAEAGRWAVRTTIATVFGMCAAFWAMIYFVVAALIG
ncbi:hypothetical protein [Parvularcula dongshanensis]|uniref:Uncharacterized protein n=1 Tax=Parvularcula dongshanensis TaxID=1173995 RepID=A0A840I0W0_9PROT|nr:hypothetical protein [Parvularcula dongshanensis]MBB4657903.1 hypothetical protein [Parvularcula dongshanensis]